LQDRGRCALGTLSGQVADAADVAGALGDADGAAGIQQIEGMGAFQAVFIGRQHQPVGDHFLGFGFVAAEKSNSISTSAFSKL
jgi:hypothetical protein